MKRILILFIGLCLSQPIDAQSSSILDYWMLEDLSVTKFRNGEKIFHAQTNQEWQKASDEGIAAYCFNMDDPTKGILYNWAAVNDPRGLAPEGWQIPSKADYEKMNNSGISLKSVGGWDSEEKSFGIRANGYRSYDGNEFHSRRYLAYYWTSDRAKTYHSWAFYIGVDSPKGQFLEERRENGFSVRCVKQGGVQEVKVVQPITSNLSCLSGNCQTGKGKLKLENGDIYDGNFSNGKKSGYGVMTYVNGDTYAGNWSNDVRSGTGSYTYTDGNTFKGEWKNDKRNGAGVFTYKSGDVYEGNYEDNLRVGEGKYTWTTGDVYEGEWLNNVRSGYGIYTWKNGDSYYGQWLEGKRNGYGMITLVSGSSYIGEWKDSKKHGEGIYTYASGKRYEGMFVEDKFSGYGTMYETDGTKKSGTWENDILVKEESFAINTKKIDFKNNSTSKVDIAVAYYNGKEWMSVGWYKVNAGESFTYNLGEYKYTYIYWYAQSLPDNKVWTGDTPICVSSNAFELSDKNSCYGRTEQFNKLMIDGDVTRKTLID